jgi:enoyl-CoA hydratase/carnithine racemase
VQALADIRSDLDDHVATLTLDRPEQRNALSDELLGELVERLAEADADARIRCVVIAGSERVFAAGADLRQLAEQEVADVFLSRRAALWQAVRQVRTPLVAAVSGHCLGGGCELALSCDLVVASETARFGQPETGIGLIPGAGGTQFLARWLGKGRAMDMVLTGRVLDAGEAYELGLVARLAAAGEWLAEAQALARAIADRPPVAQLLAKDAVLRAFETPLAAGLAHERAAFHTALASDDAREGLRAFLERRKPVWRGR